MDNLISSDDEHPQPTDLLKKRRSRGLKQIAEKMSHNRNNNCKCKRNCMGKLSDNQLLDLLTHFNALCSIDEQDSYLAGQICVMPVARHRVRKPDGVRNTSSCTNQLPSKIKIILLFVFCTA